jgi:transposase
MTQTHRNAPLTPEGRMRLVIRCRTRPIAHVAAEMGISRATASKWVGRYKRFGELGLRDRSSAPARQPTATPARLVEQIESLRRKHKWSASRIAFELEQAATPVSRRTITRLLTQLGLNRRKFIDPNGENNREVKKIVAKRPGHMIHLDVKKAGRIPDGGGWRAHVRDSPEARAVARAKGRGTRTGYVYLHSAIDGHTRLAYTEALENEQAATDRIPRPRSRVVRQARHHEDRADNHRQGRLLPRPSVHGCSRRCTPPPHKALHAQAQRQSRALQPHTRGRVPPRPHLAL